MNNSLDKSDKSFNSLTIKEISSIFSHIDEQIIELLKCSSDDFLGLNSDFKRYYKHSRVISDNALEVFNHLSQNQDKQLFHQLQVLYKDLKTIKDQFSKQLENSIEKIRNLIFLIDELYLPVNNFNQDLMTLKLLLANLKLSSKDLSARLPKKIEQILNYDNIIIDEVKQGGLENEDKINILKKELYKGLKNFENIHHNNLADLEAIINNVHYIIILFAEKHEEAALQIPQIKQRTENCSKSIEDIITNLQYQDIIRQKMEHIQISHKKIISELDAIKLDDQLSTDQSLKINTQIRDIAGIQAALLIKANKEYQSAIESITTQFLAIGEDMTSISLMSKMFSASQVNVEEIHYSEVINKLQNSAEFLSRFQKAGKSYYNQTHKLNEFVIETFKRIPDFNRKQEQLKAATTETLTFFSDYKTSDQQQNEMLNQLSALYNDIEKYGKAIQVVYNKVIDTNRNISHPQNIFDTSSEQHKILSLTAEMMNSILTELKSRNDRIILLLNENQSISKNISDEVRKSIKKIKYYEFFEKIITRIINELNQIYIKLKGSTDVEEVNEELQKLKSLYTMASEHNVHEKVVSSNKKIDLLKDNDINTKNNDKNESNEVELF